MADLQPAFFCCTLLCKEVELAMERLGLHEAPCLSFGSNCHLPRSKMGWPPHGLAKLLESYHPVLASCMSCRLPPQQFRCPHSISSLTHPSLHVIEVQTQGELFLGADATEQALTTGAFIVLPGWLQSWRDIVVRGWGFDEETGPLFFKDSAKRLLFLDTGRKEPWKEDLEAMASFVGLPVEVRHVGISHLELLIDRALKQRCHHLEREKASRAVTESRALAAEHATVVDFINRLGSLPGEEEITVALEETARILFAPREARLGSTDAGDEGRAEEGSFTVPVEYGGSSLGTLSVREVAMPEHLQRYLPMARATCDAAAIALNASRLFHREQSLAQQLARKVEDLDQFAYLASHDLQAPLRQVTAFSGLLGEALEGKLDEEEQTYLGLIVDNAEIMRALVRDLLRLSRAGNSPLALEPLSLEACVDRALTALGAIIGEKGAEIRREPLPEAIGDSGLLAQLYQNLVGNALKFVPPERKPVVELGAERDGERWRLSVKDNGIGIDPEFAERIFTPFQRLHTSTEYQGSGIGLSICRRVVERHGGEIWVEPGEDSGSTFTFTIPVLAGPAAEEESE